MCHTGIYPVHVYMYRKTGVVHVYYTYNTTYALQAWHDWFVKHNAFSNHLDATCHDNMGQFHPHSPSLVVNE